MPIEWNMEENNLAVVHVTGQLGLDEYQQIQNQTHTTIQNVGEIKVLVLLKDFEGWGTGKGWEDTSMAERLDPYMKKMAIVGDEKWRDLVEVFTLKGLRPVPIEYFTPDNEEAARQWLAES